MPNSIKHTRSREAASWLRKEIIEQKARFRKIEREMNVTIATQRDKWIDAFLERSQTREVEGGTEVHLSGYVLPDLYLRYGMSTFDKANTFRLRYRLRRSVYVEAVSGIENAVDFLYSFER